jgi:methylenetetrahydrofolate dehydrogenase (NADP+)/methenyltetrahydrofolate cyclohydrolase
MTARIIDGKARAALLRKEVAAGVAALKSARGITPGLAVILVGDDPASKVYVRNKNNACQEVGIHSYEILKPASITQAELLAEIARLNADVRVHGILVQLPLPAHIDPEAVINAIDPMKDVDGFHVVNAGKLAIGKPGFVPCTPAGCLLLLKEQLGNLAGKHAVIVGRSNIVGKPMAQLLLMESCTVTICHSRTEFLVQETQRGDILVAAIGKPNFIKAHMIKPGATVIDVGINRLPTSPPSQSHSPQLRGGQEGGINTQGTSSSAGVSLLLPPLTSPPLAGGIREGAQAEGIGGEAQAARIGGEGQISAVHLASLPPLAGGIEGRNTPSKLVGDVEFDTAKEVAAAITPVPGGVGPMTIACLLQNTLTAAQRRANH